MEQPLQIFAEDGRPEVIAWFDDFDGPNDYAFLSNFYVGAPLYIQVYHDYFQTGEHAFAAMKAMDPRQYDAILNASDPHEAKFLGRTCDLRPDWEAVKYDAMMCVLRSKFTMARDEGQMLLDTGDALLIEGTHWGDRVWGIELPRSRQTYPFTAPGRNWLGTMLMARRAELKAESYFGRMIHTGGYNGLFARYGK